LDQTATAAGLLTLMSIMNLVRRSASTPLSENAVVALTVG
jgi:hypothetical protein